MDSLRKFLIGLAQSDALSLYLRTKETNTEHTCSWASNTHSASAMSVSVYCRVSFMNISSREQQTICQCVLTCVCIWSCVSVCTQWDFQVDDNGNSGRQVDGQECTFVYAAVAAQQRNPFSVCTCSACDISSSCCTKATSGPEVTLRREACWEGKWWCSPSERGVPWLDPPPHPPLLEFIGCAQLWHSLKSTHYPDICTHHMLN